MTAATRPVGVTGAAARFGAATFLALVVALPLSILLARPSFAVPAQPLVDRFVYIHSASTTTAYNLGCDDGSYDLNHNMANRMAVLDFFGQNSSATGTLTDNGVALSNGQVEAIAENYAKGWWACTGGSNVLWLGMGTNNSYYSVNSTGGSTWAAVVNAAANSSAGQLVADQVQFEGANDLEPSWSGASAARAWAGGWHGATANLFINFGSADGCSQTGYTSGSGYSCNNGWTQADEWYLSYGLSNALSFPEVYYSANAHQWAWISAYGKNVKGKRVNFEGPLGDFRLDTNAMSAATTWSTFYNALSNAGVGQTPQFEGVMVNE